MKTRDRFLDVLGPEMLKWGRELHVGMSRAFDPPTVSHKDANIAIGNVGNLPTREWRTKSGQVMRCTLCGDPKTIDGRYCPTHAP